MSSARRVGRPATGTPIVVRIPAELLAAIDERAATADISRAELIRRILAGDATQETN